MLCGGFSTGAVWVARDRASPVIASMAKQSPYAGDIGGRLLRHARDDRVIRNNLVTFPCHAHSAEPRTPV